MKIYHNPKCSKSRQTLQLLQDNNIQPQIIEYLNTPPTLSELQEIIKALNCTPHDILRTKEPQYKESGLTAVPDPQTILKAITQHPELLERPIVINKNNQATIGRPPENVLDLI